jgi:tRNA threonylcarbamoyl adenosine modification protein (Sua5/YciO/YrdC/YwlC family)
MGPKPPRILGVRGPGDREPALAAAGILGRGDLVILPTDTVYGVAADPRVAGAEERLCRAKGRDFAKPIPLLVAGLEQAVDYGAVFGEAERRLASAFWPGPLTLVVRVERADERGPDRRFEGLRVPDDEVALSVLRASGGVLRVTSANRSGETPAVSAEEAVRALGEHVALVLDAGPRTGAPSTVARVEDGGVRILRAGAIAGRTLQRILGSSCPGA